MSYIYVNDGSRFYFDNPVMPPRHVVTRALSMINRYTGHTIRPYSVAEHSLRGYQHVKRVEPHLARAFLLHDFSEFAYMDMNRPLKMRNPQYSEQEETFQRWLFGHYGEPWEHMAAIAKYDRGIGGDEINQLMVGPPDHDIEPLGIKIPTGDIDWRLVWRWFDEACAKENIQ